MSKTTERARGIDRALEILECLHSAHQPLRIGDIARRLDAPRSTIYELVSRLLKASILESYDDEGRVFFGRALHFYAADYLETNGLSRLARDEVIDLAARTGETTQFCMLHGNKYTVLHMQPGRKVFRITSEVGVAVPIPWTASGRLLLGHMTKEEIERFVPDEDFVLPDGRRLDLGTFYNDVRQARHDGFCITSGLVDNFTDCLAAPVDNADGVAVACVCIVIMEWGGDTDKARLIEILQESAQRLSRYLRGTNPRLLGADDMR